MVGPPCNSTWRLDWGTPWIARTYDDTWEMVAPRNLFPMLLCRGVSSRRHILPNTIDPERNSRKSGGADQGARHELADG